MTDCYLITCEHASSEVPQEYTYLFAGQESALKTHRGYDIGSKQVYERFADELPCWSQAGNYTRLLVDLNRTVNHPQLFSSFTRSLSAADKKMILEKFYFPYVSNLEKAITQRLETQERVFHLSLHSFTPTINEKERNNDIGFLYDPQHAAEKKLCLLWQSVLKEQMPSFHVRMNYPYKGTSNGLTSHFRKKYPKYHGIEVEINQRLFSAKHSVSDFIAQFLKSFTTVSDVMKNSQA
jgi:predicted N-formylglutamate amidohydrolase